MLAKKLLLATTVLAASSFVAWLILPVSQASDTVREVDASAGLQRLFRERDAGLPPATADLDEALLPRRPLDIATALTFCPLPPGNMFHPLMLKRMESNREYGRPFSEHPDGAWTIRTNTYGMREDQDPSAQRPTLRVLVAGDSHIAGLCANSDSYPNQMEQLLRAAHPDLQIEILNVATGGWSFYNYLGALETYLWLEPDVFVVTVYGGNDFGTLPIHHYHRGEPLHLTSRELLDSVKSVRQMQGGTGQFWTQAAYFASNPDEESSALQMALNVSARMQQIAARNGIELIGVYLPPLRDIQRRHFEDLLDEAEQVLALDERALGLCNRLGDAWLDWFREHDLRAVDLRPAFRTAETPLFWRTDQHLNVDGQRLIAEQVSPLLALLLE